MNVSKNAIIGKNVKISNSAIIHQNVIIEDNVFIGDFCTIGSSNINNINSKTVIKKNTNINSHSIIYHDVIIGEFSIVGHRALIREKTEISNNVQIGSYSDIEGYSKIGEHTKLHSNVHVGQHSNIMNYCWLFPYVILTNDPIPPSDIRMGVTVEPFALICTGSVILPGKKIGFGSFVGANSLVNLDLPMEQLGLGNPFIIKGSLSRLKNPKTGEEAYPWAGRFEKNYPKNIKEIYNTIRKDYVSN